MPQKVIGVDTKGNSVITSATVTRKGERESVAVVAAGADIWRGNDLSPAPASTTSIPTPSSAGEQMSVVSENAADTLLGTGAQKVTVEYLDASGNEQTTTVDMNGTTPVNLTPADARFINDFYVSQVGSNGVAVGHVKIHKASTVNLVYDMIAAGGNKSLVPHYMVPSGKELWLETWHAGEAQGKRINIRIRSDCTPSGVRQAGVFLFKDTAYLGNTTSGALPLFDVIPALSIVKVSGWSISPGAEVGCRWSGRLADVG